MCGKCAPPAPTMPALGRQRQVGVCECSYAWECDLFQCGCPGGKHLPFASCCPHSAPSVSRGPPARGEEVANVGRERSLGLRVDCKVARGPGEHRKREGSLSFLQRRLRSAESPASPHSLHTHTGGGGDREGECINCVWALTDLLVFGKEN